MDSKHLAKDSINELKTVKRGSLTHAIELEVITPSGGSIEVPFHVVSNHEEYLDATKFLLDLAKSGLPVAFATEAWNALRLSKGVTGSRALIKPLSAHNEKLGIDYDKIQRMYKVHAPNAAQQLTQHPVSSAYYAVIDGAAEVVNTAGYTEWAKALIKQKENYTLEDLAFRKALTGNVPSRSQMQAQGLARTGLPTVTINREIYGLKEQILTMQRQIEEDQRRHEDESGEFNQIVRTLEKRPNITPEALLQYPSLLRHHVQQFARKLEQTPELLYCRSLLDPFHPSVKGVRTPRLVPQPTATYQTYDELSLIPTDGAYVFYSLTATGKERLFQWSAGYSVLENQTVQELLASPAEFDITEDVDQAKHQVATLRLNPAGLTTAASIIASMQFAPSAMSLDMYTKAQIVSAGIRGFKVSSSDNEQGTLDVVHGKYGLPFDSGHTFRTAVGRPNLDQKRVYLPQVSPQNEIRGRGGFMFQSVYRPTNQQEVEQMSANLEMPSPTPDKIGNLLGKRYPFHLVLLNADADYVIVPLTPDWATLSYAAEYSRATEVYLLVDSLQNPHTGMLRFTPTAVQVELAIVQNVEGVVDFSSQGVETHVCMLSEKYETTLGLQRRFEPNQLFQNTDALLQAYLSRHFGTYSDVAGFWYTPLVSLFQDIVGWGANTLSEGDTLDSLISAVGDLAAGALGTAVPELLPFIASLKPTLERTATQASKAAVSQIRDWAKHEDEDRPEEHKDARKRY